LPAKNVADAGQTFSGGGVRRWFFAARSRRPELEIEHFVRLVSFVERGKLRLFELYA